MNHKYLIKTLRDELNTELCKNILPFWTNRSIDVKNGGFLGKISNDNRADHTAVKGAVLNMRILWAFSASYHYLKNENLKVLAYRAFDYICENFWDQKFGGIYWLLDFEGKSIERKKHLYAQSFGIYAFSEFYKVFQEEKALEYAKTLFFLMEKNGSDHIFGGYQEAFTRKWLRLEDTRLSYKDEFAHKSANTHLHILECYSNLYSAWKPDILKERIINLTEVFGQYFFQPDRQSLYSFLSTDWTPKSGANSYGHDIEVGWLLCKASVVLNNASLVARSESMAKCLYKGVLEYGIDSKCGGLLHTKNEDGTVDADKHWWPQAEAMIGFFNAYEITGEKKYLDAAVAIWQFVKQYLIDRINGEWYETVNSKGEVVTTNKVSFWKGPYHNIRAALEIIKKADVLLSREGQ